MKAFTSMSDEQITAELLVFCIAERFDRDIQWLTRAYDEDHSDEKGDDLRSWLIRANPQRHSSIAPDEIDPGLKS